VAKWGVHAAEGVLPGGVEGPLITMGGRAKSTEEEAATTLSGGGSPSGAGWKVEVLTGMRGAFNGRSDLGSTRIQALIGLVHHSFCCKGGSQHVQKKEKGER